MNRYLSKYINEICFKHGKIAIVSGPRQSGKTTFAKEMLAIHKLGAYFNWDQDSFRLSWVKNPQKLVEPYQAHKSPALIVLDEIHKDRVWKRRVKGLYDTLPSFPHCLITGSARLNVYRRGSDSLVGRAFHFNFHPLTLAEVLGKDFTTPERFIQDIAEDRFAESGTVAQIALEEFMTYVTFPEPFFKKDENFLNAWRRSRLNQILQEDVRDISAVQDITKLEILYDLLTERVGSLVGKVSLRQVLESSFDSVTRWLDILHALFITFEISPYSTKISRALRREKKVYLWEISNIKDRGARFENMVALHLLKACQLWSDIGLAKYELHFIRTKDGAEVDFLITKDRKPWLPVEVKLSDTQPSPYWRKLLPELRCDVALQLVAEPGVRRVFSENKKTLFVRSAADVLAGLG